MEVEMQLDDQAGSVVIPEGDHPDGATVSAPKAADRESAVLGEDQWEAIRQRRAAGASISAIARDLQLDRKTVRRCIRQGHWQPYQRKPAMSTLLEPHRQWLVDRAAQVRYSARILWQELRAQRGFTGSYELVKLAVRPLRAQAQLGTLTQRRFETAPGEQAQVDWGQATVRLGTQRCAVHIFVMTLGYSRRAYAEGFCDERMASLLTAHEHAFAHFGGCCETLLYDRMRTVVREEIGEERGARGAQFNAKFLDFAKYFGFTPRLCRPYRAQTKGKVESGVKYVKGNFLPGRVFADLEDLNAQLAAWQVEVADVRIHGTTHQRPIERFAQEAGALIDTGRQPSFLQAMVRHRVVAEDWLVSIDANRYSVPFALIGQSVQVVREGGNFVIRHRGQVVATHAVLAGRAQLSMRPEHGPGAAVRHRLSRPSTLRSTTARAETLQREVEVRDLNLYDQLLGIAQEAA